MDIGCHRRVKCFLSRETVTVAVRKKEPVIKKKEARRLRRLRRLGTDVQEVVDGWPTTISEGTQIVFTPISLAYFH